MRSKRFSVQIYNASNRLERTFSGYDTREAAERIADAKRREIENRGWNATVYIHEDHEVS